ncbi:MAG: histidine kinase [Segetibacter sp.]|nr:histidine kinase [Segetibacter sp.]
MKNLGTASMEVERLKNLEEYSILDSIPEKEYDDLTRIASQICETPISLITLVDDKRQWFKSAYGFDMRETPKEYSFCNHAIKDPSTLMIVNDSRIDDRFRDNPLVTGESQFIFYAGMPLVSPKGHALGTLCVIDTKPKTLSLKQVEALQSLTHHVVKLLEFRKKENLLENANEVLEVKNKELEKFASIAAHDIKSPLNNISTLIQLLSETYSTNLEDGAKKFLKLIDESSIKLRGLVDGILEHSRSEKLFSENKMETNFDTMIEDIVQLTDPQRKHSFVYPSVTEPLLINKTAVEQVLINLVANGIKYNDKEDVVIEIGFSETCDYYEFYLKDNGWGIDDSYHQKIFCLFEIVHSRDRYGNRGNGIGLSTVKKIVEGLGGQIKVTSKPGEGSRFDFSIKK